METRCFVVAVQPSIVIPKQPVGGRLDAGSFLSPRIEQIIALAQRFTKLDTLLDSVVEDGVCLDVVAAHSKSKPVVRASDVHHACGIYKGEGKFEAKLPLVPFPAQVVHIA